MIVFISTQNDDMMPEIAPLLDVVFILFIFLYLVSAFSVHGLDMSVPKAETGGLFLVGSWRFALRKTGVFTRKRIVLPEMI